MMDTFARATLVVVVPLQLFALLGDPQHYVLVYFLISCFALVASMCVPSLIRKIRHRGTLVLGMCCMMGAAFLLSAQDLYWFVPGLALQLFASATMAISLNLYVLRNVPREEFSRFEPIRILFAGGRGSLARRWASFWNRASLSDCPISRRVCSLSCSFACFCFYASTIRSRNRRHPLGRPIPFGSWRVTSVSRGLFWPGCCRSRGLAGGDFSITLPRYTC